MVNGNGHGSGIEDLITEITRWENDPNSGMAEAIDLFYDIKQFLRTQQVVTEKLQQREDQVMSLCSIVGVQAEEDLEPAVMKLVDDRQTANSK